MKISLLWPPELVITESMFRHFTGLAEVASYLKNNSEVRKKSGLDVQVVDCQVRRFYSERPRVVVTIQEAAPVTSI